MVQVLKALVIGMGILIVIGMGVLGYGLYKQARELDAGSPPPTAAATATPRAMVKTGFGEVMLPIPAGCQITGIKPDGDRLYVMTGPDRSCARIIIVDPKTGNVLGVLKATP